MGIIEKIIHQQNQFPDYSIALSKDEWDSIDNEVSEIVLSIRRMSTSVEASEYLDRLGQVQYILALLHFKHHLPLSEKQRELVRVFDRCDDPDVRERLFNQIKSGLF